MMSTRAKGFSLLELLIVIAIIGILMSMYLVSFGKVRVRAQGVVAAEGMRQGAIGRMADNANSDDRPPPATREDCRAAYYESIGENLYASRVLYVVRNDNEFDAYWNTLLRGDATDPLEYSNGMLIAERRDGVTEYLGSLYGRDTSSEFMTNVPVMWEFLSTNPAEMNRSSLNFKLMFADGHVTEEQYPGYFPLTRTVATLSHWFYLEKQID